jgi:hypothetical protein
MMILVTLSQRRMGYTPFLRRYTCCVNTHCLERRRMSKNDTNYIDFFRAISQDPNDKLIAMSLRPPVKMLALIHAHQG